MRAAGSSSDGRGPSALQRHAARIVAIVVVVGVYFLTGLPTLDGDERRRSSRAREISARGISGSERRRQQRFGDRPYRVLQLALDLPRDQRNERIDARCAGMIDAGLLREVRDLCQRGYGPELPPMQAIGYRHINTVVDGGDTLANALVEMQRDTRRFARRQRTWLRKVPDAVWLDPREDEAVFRGVEGFLEGC